MKFAQRDKLRRTQDFYRLLMIPGMAHCYGGEGPVHVGALDHLTTAALTATLSLGAYIAAATAWALGFFFAGSIAFLARERDFAVRL